MPSPAKPHESRLLKVLMPRAAFARSDASTPAGGGLVTPQALASRSRSSSPCSRYQMTTTPLRVTHSHQLLKLLCVSLCKPQAKRVWRLLHVACTDRRNKQAAPHVHTPVAGTLLPVCSPSGGR
jgi:hypothetical protein